MNKRILKFRVWDNEQKKFEYFELNNITVPDRLLTQDKFPVQQYTGLKDFNGRDIYEGDLVDFSGILPFQVMYLTDTEGCYYGLVSPEDSDRVYSLASDNIYEVVGNIFENSELLNK